MQLHQPTAQPVLHSEEHPISITQPVSGAVDRLKTVAEANQTPVEPVVYIVDDDASVRESLGNLLLSVGLKAEQFSTATDFRHVKSVRAPSCLVLDVRLPGMSGLDLQTELNRSGVPIPIIFITGHGDIPMSVKAMKAGAVEFLQKPFREQDLLDAIHSALAKSGSDPLGLVESPVDAESPKTLQLLKNASNPRHALARNMQVGRVIFKWSQGDLGARCGLNRSHISALEREELSVGVDAIDQIASAFSIAPHILLMPPEHAQVQLLACANRERTK